MQVQTTRFGSIQINDTDIITFRDGLLGFADLRKFVLLDDPNDEIFAWMQSCEKPHIAFPVLEPELYSESYKPTLTKTDLASVGILAAERPRLFTIVTIPEDVTQMTANMKAPLVINVKDRVAKQIVVQENDFQIKFPIFAELQKRFVQNPGAQLKAHVTKSGVAVKLPATTAPTDAATGKGSDANI
jgi:flagellar assembly factor FliW